MYYWGHWVLQSRPLHHNPIYMHSHQYKSTTPHVINTMIYFCDLLFVLFKLFGSFNLSQFLSFLLLFFSFFLLFLFLLQSFFDSWISLLQKLNKLTDGLSVFLLCILSFFGVFFLHLSTSPSRSSLLPFSFLFSIWIYISCIVNINACKINSCWKTGPNIVELKDFLIVHRTGSEWRQVLSLTSIVFTHLQEFFSYFSFLMISLNKRS